jgi:hypothetical protein
MAVSTESRSASLQMSGFKKDSTEGTKRSKLRRWSSKEFLEPSPREQSFCLGRNERFVWTSGGESSEWSTSEEFRASSVVTDTAYVQVRVKDTRGKIVRTRTRSRTCLITWWSHLDVLRIRKLSSILVISYISNGNHCVNRPVFGYKIIILCRA